MRCLGGSVLHTMGSGQWGVASDLIDRLKGVPADPAVAAIQARRHIEDGQLDRAAQLLASVDARGSPGHVRAVFRHAKLSLGWRTGDREMMLSTLAEIQADDETPPILRDIFQVFIDASPLSMGPVPYPVLSHRLEVMSRNQAEAGYSYYAAISLHNAAVAAQASGDPHRAISLGQAALMAYEQLAVPPAELHSTHAALAGCSLDLGDRRRAEEHYNSGLAGGKEHGDVHAEFALLWAITGQRERAVAALEGAKSLLSHGLSDIQGITTSLRAEAFLVMATAPDHSLELLAQIPDERPLDVGDTLSRIEFEAIALLAAGQAGEARAKAQIGLDRSRLVQARTYEAKFKLILALALADPDRIKSAVGDLARRGHLGLLEVADAVGRALPHLQPTPPELLQSMRAWPERWLPILRRELETGDTPIGRVAARVLDEVGTADDVVRLRAYAKTYNRKTRSDDDLGLKLARRVAPSLEIQDLGRVVLRIGQREVGLSKSRRKAASLLMYLVTRPRFTATREQVLDELWPDADPVSAANSLNQSLFFLRRDIDPWYEDGLSIDYVRYEGDLVWLDADLTRVQSASFLQAVRDTRRTGTGDPEATLTLSSYVGRFAPEFEYEEWAIGWRQRIHAEFLERADATLDALEGSGQLAEARDIASHVLEIDSSARDIEQRLIRIYWRLGARSAALSQFEHLRSLDTADGLEPPSLSEITG
jgi:DNA-binding SARP family transcriptional activator